MPRLNGLMCYFHSQLLTILSNIGCNITLIFLPSLTNAFKKVIYIFAPSNKLLFAAPQYLLHYLLSVRSLLNRHAWSRTPIAETALAVLKDSYHGSVCVRHEPQHLALTSLYLALQTYGVQLPRGELEWWQVGVLQFHVAKNIKCPGSIRVMLCLH